WGATRARGVAGASASAPSSRTCGRRRAPRRPSGGRGPRPARGAPVASSVRVEVQPVACGDGAVELEVAGTEPPPPSAGAAFTREEEVVLVSAAQPGVPPGLLDPAHPVEAGADRGRLDRPLRDGTA